jgi:hypothetical protein
VYLILQKLCKTNVKVIICSDINANYMEDCLRKRRFNDLLSTFNLRSIITFPTRIGSNTSTVIDNIFIDDQKYNGYEVFTVSNGLSDHEAQLLTIKLPSLTTKERYTYYSRSINKYNIEDFRIKLSYENWEYVFKNSDINTSFNLFFKYILVAFLFIFSFKTKAKV